MLSLLAPQLPFLSYKCDSRSKLYIVRRTQPKGEEETKAEPDPNANTICCVP